MTMPHIWCTRTEDYQDVVVFGSQLLNGTTGRISAEHGLRAVGWVEVAEVRPTAPNRRGTG
jgi:hypothetical protein